MFEAQEIISISSDQLLQRVKNLFQNKHRLVQISCTQNQDRYFVDYSFDDDYHFSCLRVEISSQTPVLPSISSIYFAAFLYENELHDLFGIRFEGLVLDYGGKFYRIEAQTPFRSNNTDVMIQKD